MERRQAAQLVAYKGLYGGALDAALDVVVCEMLNKLEIEIDIINMRLKYELQQLAMETKVALTAINKRYRI